MRRKVKLTYWGWADNPVHQKMSIDAVDQFNKSQEFITVELDATSLVQELRQKVAVAFAAGAAPDMAGVVQTHVQDWFDNGILQPIGEFFDKWEVEVRLLPERRRCDALEARPAGALHAGRDPALRALLPRRLVRGEQAAAAEDL